MLNRCVRKKNYQNKQREKLTSAETQEYSSNKEADEGVGD